MNRMLQVPGLLAFSAKPVSGSRSGSFLNDNKKEGSHSLSFLGISKQPDDRSVLIHVDLLGGRMLRQPRHRHDGTGQSDHKARACRNPQFPDGHAEAARHTAFFRIVGKTVLCFGDTYGQRTESERFQAVQFRVRTFGKDHAVGVVDAPSDRVEFFFNRRIRAVAEAKTVRPPAEIDHSLSKRDAARAALGEESEEGYLKMTFVIPKGERGGDPYNGYDERDAYSDKMRQDKEKAEAKAKAKAEKIARDKALREAKAKAKAKRE